MKTKQTKIDRSAAKWLPGAMALAATTASSQAATVQITLTGNKISTVGGDQLVADLTGDGENDLVVAGVVGPKGVDVNVSGRVMGARSNAPAYGFSTPWVSVDAKFALSGVGVSFDFGYGEVSASYLNAVTFTDYRINNNAPTGAWLQVNAVSDIGGPDHTIEFARLIFDTESTSRPSFGVIPGAQTEWVAVPEPSSLGLLALGAGGLLIRRSRAKAAA